MSTAHDRLESAGYRLPSSPPAPAGLYRAVVQDGSVVTTSGQICLADGELVASGLVGAAIDIPLAARCASQAALNALAALGSQIQLDDIAQWLTLRVYIATAPGFGDHVAVADGASEVLRVTHPDLLPPVRVAVGVASLPLGAPVEIELSASIGQRSDVAAGGRR